jgi:hypothetical protein
LAAAVARLTFCGDDFSSSKSDIEFVASHFDEMTASLFETLPLNLAEAILGEPGLQLQSEDDLYELIRSRFDENEGFFGLLDQVHFEYLSSSGLALFAERRFDIFGQLNPGIWDRFCGRFLQPAGRSVPNARVRDPDSSSFAPNWNGSFYGIIAGLTARYGGNVHEKGVVELSSDSSESGSLSRVVDFSNDGGFSTKAGVHSWVCYDFKDRLVTPTGLSFLLAKEVVSLISCGDRLSFDVSLDGSYWAKLRRFTASDFSRMNHQLCLCSLTPGVRECRFVRLRVVGTSVPIPLALIAWEIFGSVRLRRPDEPADSGRGPGGVDQDQPAIPVGQATSTFGRIARDQAPVPFGRGRLGFGRTEPAPPFGIRSLRNEMPPEFDGLASFLDARGEGNVEVVWPSMSSPLTYTTKLARITVQGLLLAPFDAWIELRFPHHHVRITHYVIYCHGGTSCRTCELSSSLDRQQWTVVDQRSDLGGTQFAEPSTFALATPTECSSVKIRLQGQVLDTIHVSAFDVFGSILD